MKLHHPASRYDLATCMGPCEMMAWQCAKLQIEAGDSWSLRDDEGHTLAVAGLFPNADGSAEGWFMVHDQASKHIRLIIKHIRLTLLSSSYPHIQVFTTTKAGARIAALCGLEFLEIRSGMEVWHYGRTVGGRK